MVGPPVLSGAANFHAPGLVAGNVRFWRKADIALTRTNDRFGGKADIPSECLSDEI